MSGFFVKTVINNLCRAVKIQNDEELTIAEFVERALSAHELDANEIENFEFSLTDSDHLPIDDFDMIKQWKSDSSFKVIIDLKVSRKKVDLVAESLKNFLLDENCDDLFDEHEICKGLTTKSRQKLVKCLVTFIDKQYPARKTEDIYTVCHASISLFSSLKVMNSTIGGVDLLYHPHRKSGFLFHALNYAKKRKASKTRGK